jgi:hypothetical protein
MGKIIKNISLICITTLILLSSRSYAQEYTLNDLVENAKQLDKKTITVQGEVIGEALERGEYAWININDGTNAIGVWMPKEYSDKIKIYGGYKNKGDIIQVKGTFNRACSEHGGDLDIHGKKVEVIKMGYSIKENIPQYKILTSIILTIVALSVGYILYINLKKS